MACINLEDMNLTKGKEKKQNKFGLSQAIELIQKQKFETTSASWTKRNKPFRPSTQELQRLEHRTTCAIGQKK
ncbi:hypothetical protein RRG08_007760 [Elysia crispata]|uniref:Uncharacterized protein n=1 Tax=Elysia crispata TaxID=231223 RepID=A0AAE1B1U0_9GAST|nr:hypothetical protein RRG08_007760 [Elysia crispata]